MKKRIVRLTESDLQRIVKRVIRENMINELGGMEDSHPISGGLNFSNLSPEERRMVDDYYGVSRKESGSELGDTDEYYGTFDDTLKVDRGDRAGEYEYPEFVQDEFKDFDSYKKSKYGRDPRNKMSFNTSDEDFGRRMFKTYQEKSGGKPFRVRRRK